MEFFTVPEPKISKQKIKDALKKGEELPFARLDEKETVRFK